jgi:DNA helicase-2/ATP-dependent DNA helicase PcrA
LVFPTEARRRYEGSEAEERRLFYVAMTRARDILYLSRFRKMTNDFKASPFLLEVASGDPPVVAPGKVLPGGTFTPPTDEPEEQPTVSFSELALYEQCPLRFRFSTSLGFQPQLVPELGYGKAIHHILRKIADLTKAKGSLPTPSEVDAAFKDAFYLPFANNASFHSLCGRARALVDRYIADYSADLLRVWETERAFELHLDGGIVNGRADVILDREGGVANHLAIVDYKTANDPRADDLFAFQLAIYASAGRGEGLTVDAAYLHLLKESERRPVPVDRRAVKVARQRASLLIEGVVERDFPARPDDKKCKACDMRAICKDARCGIYDL